MRYGLSEGERRLAAIMFTDIVGYTALTQSNEAQAMEVLERHNRLLRPFFPRFHGKEVKTIGDSFLVEFENALDAVKCAAEVQSYLHDYNVSSREEWKIKLRIGVHLGDVIRKERDVLGDAVNIASRIQPIAAPEGICVSRQVYDQVHNKFDLPLVSLGEKSLKNVTAPVEVYAAKMPWEQSTSMEPGSLPRDRIAILPFTSLSPDPNDAFLADGVTEEIISTVSGISGLSVISRTSVMGYKGTTKRIEEIGRELKVGSVLEGSFRKAGNRIRVTAQLIDVTADRHLWAQNYDRNLDDIFEVQSDVAKMVADALRVRIQSPELERIEKKPTVNPASYTLYLKGRYHWNRRHISEQELRRAVGYFEQAVGLDPSFALGYAGLADSYEILVNNWGVEPAVNRQKAKEAIAKALELDPDIAEAHAANGLIMLHDFDMKRAEEEFEKAVALKPNYSPAHLWFYLLLAYELRFDEAKNHIKKAVDLDPLSPTINWHHAAFYFFTKEYSSSLELFKKNLQLEPEDSWSHESEAHIYGKLKLFDEMKKEFEIAADLLRAKHPMIDKDFEAWAAYYMDNPEGVRKMLPPIEANLEKANSLYFYVAGLYFFLHENDKGFKLLEQSFKRKEFILSSIKVYDLFDGIRTDPRYLDLLKRLGLN